MTGLCVLFLGLPILVISNAAVEALIIVLDSLTRPTSRASTKTLSGTNLKRIGQFCRYLSGHLRYIQLLHEAATTSILDSNSMQSTVPQHRKARRKRRHVGSYRYLRYLVTTHFWNPPWDTGGSPQRRVYVSEGDRRVGGSAQRRVYVSEGDRRVALESVTRQMTHWQQLPQEPSTWNPFALLSPRAQGTLPIACFTTTHSVLSATRAMAFDTDSAPVGIDNRC
jgi:hypothetical protein